MQNIKLHAVKILIFFPQILNFLLREQPTLNLKVLPEILNIEASFFFPFVNTCAIKSDGL